MEGEEVDGRCWNEGSEAEAEASGRPFLDGGGRESCCCCCC